MGFVAKWLPFKRQLWVSTIYVWRFNKGNTWRNDAWPSSQDTQILWAPVIECIQTKRKGNSSIRIHLFKKRWAYWRTKRAKTRSTQKLVSGNRTYQPSKLFTNRTMFSSWLSGRSEALSHQLYTTLVLSNHQPAWELSILDSCWNDSV